MTTHGDNSPPLERASHRASARPITVHRCQNSHAFFFPHDACPRCAAPLAKTESPPDAVLVSHTTVRIGPGGTPFGLGLAKVACGAQTLCIIEVEPGNDPELEVVIEKRAGLYRARPKPPP